MRPSIMLLLRALLIMGSILAVMSCSNPVSTESGTPRPRPPVLEPTANVAVRTTTTCGAIQFALNAGSYSSQSVPAAGGTFSDSGTGTCHRAVTTHSRREV
ncbi:MAG: hypothetical protein WD773_05380 [Gemmatimonadales bacterium]